MAKKTTGRLRLYKSYMFRDKDPVIDQLRTLVQDNLGSVKHKALKEIENNGGPVATTMVNWFNGDTKRPNNCSIEAAGRAIGMKRVWVKHKK